jgi:hypothetical protein
MWSGIYTEQFSLHPLLHVHARRELELYKPTRVLNAAGVVRYALHTAQRTVQSYSCKLNAYTCADWKAQRGLV